MFGTSRIMQFQQAIEDNGFDQASHYSLGVEYLKEGRYMEAGAKFRRAVELNPEYVEAWLGLGEAYNLAGVPKEAESAWRTGLGVARRVGKLEAARELDALHKTVASKAR